MKSRLMSGRLDKIPRWALVIVAGSAGIAVIRELMSALNFPFFVSDVMFRFLILLLLVQVPYLKPSLLWRRPRYSVWIGLSIMMAILLSAVTVALKHFARAVGLP